MLGTIAMICAPALLLEGLFFHNDANNVAIGVCSAVFMAGWICSNIGMTRLGATGHNLWGRLVLRMQLVGLVLACLFGVIEATRALPANNIIFIVTDMAWPISMAWMLVVGISVLVARQLSGWQRWVPLFWGLALPTAVVLSIVTGAPLQGSLGLFFFGWLAVAALLLGYSVFSSERAPVLVAAARLN
jgi:hypothetical protein